MKGRKDGMVIDDISYRLPSSPVTETNKNNILKKYDTESLLVKTVKTFKTDAAGLKILSAFQETHMA